MMKNIHFNKPIFFRTIFIFLILMIFWTALSLVTEDFFSEVDRGFRTGLGYLILFPFSIYLGVIYSTYSDDKPKGLGLFVLLTGITIVIFLIGSFVPLLFIEIIPVPIRITNFLYPMINSLFVSVTMTFF